MLEDPWLELENKAKQADSQIDVFNHSDDSNGDVNDATESSMIPQVGESISERLNPAPEVDSFVSDVPSQYDETDNNDYETNQSAAPSTSTLEKSDVQEEKQQQSDSMIPLVGDSILNQSVSSQPAEENKK